MNKQIEKIDHAFLFFVELQKQTKDREELNYICWMKKSLLEYRKLLKEIGK